MKFTITSPCVQQKKVVCVYFKQEMIDWQTTLRICQYYSVTLIFLIFREVERLCSISKEYARRWDYCGKCVVKWSSRIYGRKYLKAAVSYEHVINTLRLGKITDILQPTYSNYLYSFDDYRFRKLWYFWKLDIQEIDNNLTQLSNSIVQTDTISSIDNTCYIHHNYAFWGYSLLEMRHQGFCASTSAL